MTIEIDDALAIELHRIALRIDCSVAEKIYTKDDLVYVKKLKVSFGEFVALSEIAFAIREEIRKEINAIGDLPF